MTTSEGTLPLDADHAADLLHLLETIDDILRYGGDDLRADIADRYHPRMHEQLSQALEFHACLLHHAITRTRRTPHHDN